MPGLGSVDKGFSEITVFKPPTRVMLRRAGNVALAHQELCGQSNLRIMLCEQQQR